MGVMGAHKGSRRSVRSAQTTVASSKPVWAVAAEAASRSGLTPWDFARDHYLDGNAVARYLFGARGDPEANLSKEIVTRRTFTKAEERENREALGNEVRRRRARGDSEGDVRMLIVTEAVALSGGIVQAYGNCSPKLGAVLNNDKFLGALMVWVQHYQQMTGVMVKGNKWEVAVAHAAAAVGFSVEVAPPNRSGDDGGAEITFSGPSDDGEASEATTILLTIQLKTASNPSAMGSVKMSSWGSHVQDLNTADSARLAAAEVGQFSDQNACAVHTLALDDSDYPEIYPESDTTWGVNEYNTMELNRRMLADSFEALDNDYITREARTQKGTKAYSADGSRARGTAEERVRIPLRAGDTLICDLSLSPRGNAHLNSIDPILCSPVQNMWVDGPDRDVMSGLESPGAK
jgi:hypothetical protein